MSHIATVDLEVNSLAALKKAAGRLGLAFVEDQQTYRWFGRSVGDYPLPAGFRASDLGRCDHAIRIPGNTAAYEIGVVARRDGKPGYQLLWDFWQGGFGMEDRVGKGGGLLKQAYAIERATQEYISEGYYVEEIKKEDGEIELIASR